LLQEDNTIGEIIVKGPVVTRAYDNNDRENELAKIADNTGFWHRMGDVGYFDEKGRLWFCGRKGHRVITGAGTMYTVCCEALFNEHPAVFRAALVGVGQAANKIPVMLVELHNTGVDEKSLLADLEKIAGEQPLTSGIKHFLIHPGFPVDIRHNAKIFREKLASYAEDKLQSTMKSQVES
jgi:acyl-CoA synthetase (AMP-forming)/AMP-acid ligase II